MFLCGNRSVLKRKFGLSMKPWSLYFIPLKKTLTINQNVFFYCQKLMYLCNFSHTLQIAILSVYVLQYCIVCMYCNVFYIQQQISFLHFQLRHRYNYSFGNIFRSIIYFRYVSWAQIIWLPCHCQTQARDRVTSCG